ncbi:hypothetical protein CXF68_20380 [Tenacibaculum sp. Bg11-29]|nr:hypothetical protein CXF68_20380 [Tenacibaculum sp. Bg11-29]
MSQNKVTHITPSSIIDSLFISIKDNNYEKFSRQFFSVENSIKSRGKLFQSFTKGYQDTLKTEYKEHIKKTISESYKSLKDTINKYKLDLKDQLFNEFRFFTVNDKNDSIYFIKSDRNIFTFLKDSTIIDIYVDDLYYFNNKWKSEYKIRLTTAKLNKEHYNLKHKPFLINTTPEDFLDYSKRIFFLIKHKKIAELEKEFPTPNQLKSFRNFSESSFKIALESLNDSKKRLKKEFWKYNEIIDFIPEKTYISWFKRKHQLEPKLFIILKVKTDEGIKKLIMRCIVTKRKIFLIDIETELTLMK